MFPNTILPLNVPLHFVETYPLPLHCHTDCSHPLNPSEVDTKDHNSALHNDSSLSTNHTSTSTAHALSSHTDHASSTGVGYVPSDRPKRQVKPPTYLSEYHCNLLPFSSFSSSSFPTEQKTPYLIFSVLSYDCLSPHFQASILAYTLETEPKTFKQAMASEKSR